MADPSDERRLVGFEPAPAAPRNGSRTRRRPRLLTGVAFGFLIGALLATSLVGRLQWLNLASVGWWGRPVIAALAAGAMVGLMRGDRLRYAMVGGALAAVIALWGVYGIVRLSVRVLFVERSITQVILADLARLFAYAAPAGAVGAAGIWWARRGWMSVFRRFAGVRR